jgi:hypothetical protein
VLGAVVVWLVRRPVEIESYDLDAADRAACEAFVADLPDDALGAAYGDPEITVTCGIPVPDAFDQTSSCLVVDGVGWYVPDGSDDDRGVAVRLSTPGFRPVVEVVVPSDYRPADRSLGDDTTAAAIATLTPLVREHLTLVKRCDG